MVRSQRMITLSAGSLLAAGLLVAGAVLLPEAGWPAIAGLGGVFGLALARRAWLLPGERRVEGRVVGHDRQTTRQNGRTRTTAAPVIEVLGPQGPVTFVASTHSSAPPPLGATVPVAVNGDGELRWVTKLHLLVGAVVTGAAVTVGQEVAADSDLRELLIAAGLAVGAVLLHLIPTGPRL